MAKQKINGSQLSLISFTGNLTGFSSLNATEKEDATKITIANTGIYLIILTADYNATAVEGNYGSQIRVAGVNKQQNFITATPGSYFFTSTIHVITPIIAEQVVSFSFVGVGTSTSPFLSNRSRYSIIRLA